MASTITSSRPSAASKKFNLLSKNVSKNISKMLPRVSTSATKALPVPMPPAVPTPVTNDDLAGFFVNLPPEAIVMEAGTSKDGALRSTGTIKPVTNTPIGYGFEIIDGKIVRTADFPPTAKAQPEPEVSTEVKDAIAADIKAEFAAIKADFDAKYDAALNSLPEATQAKTDTKDVKNKVKKVNFVEPMTAEEALKAEKKQFQKDLAYAKLCIFDAFDVLPSASTMSPALAADPDVMIQLHNTNVVKQQLESALKFWPSITVDRKRESVTYPTLPPQHDHRCQAPAGYYTESLGWFRLDPKNGKTKGAFYYKPGFGTYLSGGFLINDASNFDIDLDLKHQDVVCIHWEEYKKKQLSKSNPAQAANTATTDDKSKDAQSTVDASAQADDEDDSYTAVTNARIKVTSSDDNELETASVADSATKVTAIDGGENKDTTVKGGENKAIADADDDAVPYTVGDLASAPTAAFFDGYNPGHMPYYQEAECRWTHNIPGNGSHDFLERESGCFRHFWICREIRDTCGDVAEWFKAKLRYRELMKNSGASVYMKQDYWGNDMAGFIDGREDQMIWRTRRMRNDVFNADGLLQPRSYPQAPTYWFHTQ